MKNQKSVFSTLLVLSLAVGLLSQSAFAMGRNFEHNHPRRAEVLGRDNNLGNRIRNDRGQLGGNYGALSAQDRAIHRQEQRDARMNGGHITQAEQHQLNREENNLNREVRRDHFGDVHPRRAEVLGRDNHLGNQLSQDKGQLGGNYDALRAQDRAIRRQEQRDARMNGGHITQGEQNQLNREENNLHREIRNDHQ